MKLFDKLFKPQETTKERLILAIAALRIRSDPASAVMGITPDALDRLPKVQLMGLPEASLVTIVETFVALRRGNEHPHVAIQRIESHRAQSLGALPLPIPTGIYDYTAKRLKLEHPHGFQMDQAFIDNAVHTSASVFGLELELPTRPPFVTHKEFELGQFRCVIASYERRERGYLFPWRLLAFDAASGAFGFSYNLEVTSASCCLGSHSSDGSHFNFGEADPDMSMDEFQEWAIPRAIEQIFGDGVLTSGEAELFAVKVVAEYLEKDGLRIDAVNGDSRSDPQLWARREDDSLVAVVVRAAAFPEKGEIADDCDRFDRLLMSDYEGTIYFASVGLANADARNDFERRVLLRNGRFHVAYSGVEEY